MATLDDVAKIALGLPDAVEGERHGGRVWGLPRRDGKLHVFAWERGYSKADLKRFGDVEPPKLPNVAVMVEDLHAKEAALASGERGFFTIEHFDNHPMFLINLRTVRKPALREAIIDAYEATKAKHAKRR